MCLCPLSVTLLPQESILRRPRSRTFLHAPAQEGSKNISIRYWHNSRAFGPAYCSHLGFGQASKCIQQSNRQRSVCHKPDKNKRLDESAYTLRPLPQGSLGIRFAIASIASEATCLKSAPGSHNIMNGVCLHTVAPEQNSTCRARCHPLPPRNSDSALSALSLTRSNLVPMRS